MKIQSKASLFAFFIATLFFSGSLFAVDSTIAPELSTSDLSQEKIHDLPSTKKAFGKQAMVVTANPYATDVALKILQQGGTAVDAALAAQLVLGLVEPQSSGIGGGGFLLYWDNQQKQLTAWDGRETAPAAVDENWFLDENGKPLQFFDAVVGGRSVGVPGILDLFEKLHIKHGKKPWAENFHPAIQLAEKGFVVSPRLSFLLENLYGPKPQGQFKKIYYPNGKALQPGELFKNRQYARSLEQLANNGAKDFYRGRIAQSIVTAVSSNKKPGALSTKDMASYQAKARKPLCKTFLEYNICGMPPPSSGASTVAAILGVMENFPLQKLEPSQQAHIFMESSKLAFADRDFYLADTDFVSIPLQQLLADQYLKNRAALISANAVIKQAQPGLLNSETKEIKNPELPSTTHLGIVDQYGNIVSMTSSIEMAFGSRVMAGGFLLNNQLTDFSFSPKDQNQQWVNNRVQPGKRPRSSMAPTIVFKNKQPVLVIGSPGGSRIIDFVAKALLEILAYDKDIEQAINAPHWIAMNRGKVELEEGAAPSLLKALQQLGHTVSEKQHSSGLHVIAITDQGLTGAADKRREGVAAGF